MKSLKSLNEQLEATKKAIRKIKSDFFEFIKTGNVKCGDWYILNKNDNKVYYQYSHILGTEIVRLRRHSKNVDITIDEFLSNYVKATEYEAYQHINFLLKRGDDFINKNIVSNKTTGFFDFLNEYVGDIFQNPNFILSNNDEVNDLINRKKCEFYMVTCRGNYGAKIRHSNYDNAVLEAERIAKRENHPTWVVGVVKKINP